MKRPMLGLSRPRNQSTQPYRQYEAPLKGACTAAAGQPSSQQQSAPGEKENAVPHAGGVRPPCMEAEGCMPENQSVAPVNTAKALAKSLPSSAHAIKPKFAPVLPSRTGFKPVQLTSSKASAAGGAAAVAPGGNAALDLEACKYFCVLYTKRDKFKVNLAAIQYHLHVHSPSLIFLMIHQLHPRRKRATSSSKMACLSSKPMQQHFTAW